MVPFDLKRAVVLTAFGASFAWLNARNATPERIPASEPPVRETRARQVEPTPTITRLHDWRPRNGELPARARNVFAFGATAPRAADAVRHRVDSPLPEIPVQLPPSLPTFKVVGLAEDASPTGPIRTAVISGAGQLFVVKDGEMVTPRYRVASVLPDRVELTDLASGTIVRLLFR